MIVDPITLELVKNAVESVVDEMALTIMRTAYSSNLKSSNDLSAAYCSLDGELLAQGFTLPMQLGSIPDAMQAVVAKFGGRFERGNASDSTEIYQEGLRLPPIKLYEAGRPNQAIFDIIEKNVRVSENLLGDLRAQLAAIHIGERGMEDLVARWGKTELFEILTELM